MQYLKAEPVYHTFLLSDLECYGFEHEFQQVYMQDIVVQLSRQKSKLFIMN